MNLIANEHSLKLIYQLLMCNANDHEIKYLHQLHVLNAHSRYCVHFVIKNKYKLILNDFNRTHIISIIY